MHVNLSASPIISWMELSYPIPTNPEFSILESPGYREYRVEKRRRPSQRRQVIVSFFFFFSLAVALYWQSVKLLQLLVLDPITHRWLRSLAKLSSSSGYTFIVASAVSCIVLGFFGQVLYGELFCVCVFWRGGKVNRPFRISHHPRTSWHPAWNSSRVLNQTALAYQQTIYCIDSPPRRLYQWRFERVERSVLPRRYQTYSPYWFYLWGCLSSKRSQKALYFATILT